MDTSETITRVFTKYDTVPRQIDVPTPAEIKPIPWRAGDIITFPIPRRYCIEKVEVGLEDVVIAHYAKEG